MTEWSLKKLLSSLHDSIEERLGRVRDNFGHSVAKGDASENVWLELFGEYLPKRYRVANAYIVDSNGKFSEQIDVAIFDRQYSPLIFSYERQTVVPAESVYAVFEAKQSINAENIEYAQKKVRSVRCLHRTSLPIPHAGGTYKPRCPNPILGGILAFQSAWKPALDRSLVSSLRKEAGGGRLDVGCVAAHGYFSFDQECADYRIHNGGKPATAFLLDLISRLQVGGTVPMIDVQAYAKWLSC